MKTKNNFRFLISNVPFLSRRSFRRNRIQSFLRLRVWVLLPSVAAMLTLGLATASSSFAGNATWLASPANTDWNSAANWTAGGPPNGSTNTATFATSNIKRPVISATTEVNGIVFNPGASAFTIASNPAAVPVITISGVGVTNNSGIVQHFVVNAGAAQISFLNSATAGSLTAYTSFGTITFGASSTADNATFTNNAFLNFANTATAGDATFNNNSVLIFDDNSTAGNGTFNNGTLNTSGGFIQFGEDSSDAPTAGNGIFNNLGSPSNTVGGGFVVIHFGTAGDATFINDGATARGGIAGETLFQDTGDAGNAILIANGGVGGGDGGSIQFATASTGGTARIEVFGSGKLDISGHNAPGITTGSIEGSGLVFLGARNLAVGANNPSTTFSGVIQNGGASGGTGGSLTKIGTGTLTLNGANTYTGGTIVNTGTLLVSNTTGSGAGTGSVNVNAGTLGGSGIITGAVTIGTANGAGAFLAPAGGTKRQATLTTQNGLTFNARSTYTYTFRAKGNRTRSDQVVAMGVTIDSGATFVLHGTVQGGLQAGLVLTAIKNTSATPINGTFGNLPDGAILAINGNNLQASYEGGDGNDLTLTLIP